MDVEMDFDKEAGREVKPSLLVARQRRPQKFATNQQMSSSMPSSTSTTSFPSPMNNHPEGPNHPFNHQMTAPLPSPSAHNVEPIYPRSQSTLPNTSNPHFQPQYQPQNQQSQAVPQQATHFSQQNHPFGHQSQQPAQNDPAATTEFLKDFNLVAEAAKRAQMAVVMRDLESVSL